MAETLHEMAVRMVKGEDCQPQCGKGCDKCPAGKLRSANGVCLVRRIARVDNCEEQIEGLRAWAKEHPAPRYPTWREWQKNVFPDAGDDMYPCNFLSYAECGCKWPSCIECRERPIPADIAAKLGIRPINEGCENCKYTDKAEDEEPCVRCRHTQPEGSARWAEMPDLWKEG